MPTLSIDDALKNLNAILRSLLGPDGVNVLGTYKVDRIGTAPACQIRGFSNVEYTFVDNSGIECVIYPDPDRRPEATKFGVSNRVFFQVTLDQHDRKKNLSGAIDAIYSHPTIRPLGPPVIRPRTEKANEKGEYPARAILYIPFDSFQRNLF